MILPGSIRSQLNLLLARGSKFPARDERGVALVETAISMMTLLMLIFAVFEGSLEIYSYHFVANAAHEGTRYAIVRGASWANSCDGTGAAGSGYGSSMCQASPTDIANYVAGLNFAGVNVTANNVCVEYFDPSTTFPGASGTCTGNSSPNAPGDLVQVTITYPFTIAIPLLPGYTMSLSSTSQMTIAQ